MEDVCEKYVHFSYLTSILTIKEALQYYQAFPLMISWLLVISVTNAAKYI